MPGVILDAGHGGFDNGAQYNGRREKDDNLRLTLAVGEILARNGIPVSYTRQSDIYQSPSEKARIGNASGADYFISFHRNSSPNANQYHGVETLVFDDSGRKAEMARNINAQLENIGFRNIGVQTRPNLTVLRRTNIPAVLIETGFINSDQDNERFDERFQDIAQAIADGIMEAIGTGQMPLSGIYRVQIGLYRNFSNAQYALNEAVAQGFDGDIVYEAPYYAVQLGEFDTLDEAVNLENQLKQKGYDTLVVKK
ncbi:N-acetylmuramoyl-L-alanine amidase [Anaerostipes faecalis]|uniref:N-acetylmuramoyl-L-alanine amidase n=1 Tax=Anaerostipes faecalis TaxID=2738446 RepID=UPI001C1E47BE|nr:N-acetylmuramoyl-L-alanine amidase [Anaerostipes faecalis]